MFSVVFSVLLSCSSAPAPAPSQHEVVQRAELKAHMQQHLTLIGAARAALIQGNLSGVAGPARRFVEHPVSHALPGHWLPYVTEMGSAAVALRSATALAPATEALTQLAGACGACHVALGVTPQIRVNTSAVAGVEHHESRFNAALDLMWTALILRSNTRWQQGQLAYEASRSGHSALRPIDAWRPAGPLSKPAEWAGREAVLSGVIFECAQCHQGRAADGAKKEAG